MWLLLLAYLERTLEWVQSKADQAKQKLREWLGPGQQNFHLLADGRVLPAHIQIPEEERATTFVYEAATHRMTRLNEPTPPGRFRQLPIIACSIEKGGTIYDFSEWLSEIRANPATPTVSLKQYAQLWSFLTGAYIPISGRVTFTSNSGDVQTEIWA